MTLPACRGSGKSPKKLRKTRASLRAPGLEEGSCNVIAALRHDQSATDRITPNQAAGRLEVRPESPCRTILGWVDHPRIITTIQNFSRLSRTPSPDYPAATGPRAFSEPGCDVSWRKSFKLVGKYREAPHERP